MSYHTRGGHGRLFTIVILLAMVLGAWLSLPGAVEADTVVIDPSAGTVNRGALFRVDPTTGTRTLLSDFGNAGQGPLGDEPVGVALEAGGAILVIDRGAGTGTLGALFRVDPTTGTRTLLSDFGNAGQGPLGNDLFGVALEAGGAILVIDPSAGTVNRGALFRVDPTTGTRTLLSDFGNAGQGPLGTSPFGVAVSSPATGIPTLSEWAQVGMAALLVGGGLLALRKSQRRRSG